MGFLKAALAAKDVSDGLHKNHGAVRDFMRELLSGVRPESSVSAGKYKAAIAWLL